MIIGRFSIKEQRIDVNTGDTGGGGNGPAFTSREFYGDIRGDSVRELNFAGHRDPMFLITGLDHELSETTILPCFSPGKIIGIGLNYKAHAAELKMEAHKTPIIFIKPTSTVISNGESIKVSDQVGQVDFEGELAIIIGKPTYKVTVNEAKDHILGYTCANDVTNRDIQKEDGQWIRAKGFNTFLPLGPYIATDIDPTDLEIKVTVNGEIKQDSHTTDMINNVYELVSFVSQVMPLEPFDVIISGTPPGIGPIKPGDVVEVEIENIGKLTNRVD